MSLNRHVIRAHRPLRNAIVVVVLVAAAAGGSAYLWLDREEQTGLDEVAILERERDKLEDANRALRKDLEDLGERMAILERTRQIEGKAYADIDHHLRNLQNEVLALKEEVAFYRGILSPDKKKGLNIQAFELDREGANESYRFELVLTRNMKNDHVVKGDVSLSVSGEQKGQSKQLSLRELSGRETRKMEFQFKYFQRLEGHFSLPDGFVPHRIFVQITSSDRKNKTKSFQEAFDWQGLVG